MESAGSNSESHLRPPSASCHDDGNSNKAQAGAVRPSPRPERNSIVPPYWQRHERNESTLSAASAENLALCQPILLEDHTNEGSEQCKALWAKHVSIDDYVIVSGSAPGLGAYVVWNCTVETLDGGPMKIMKRFSEFDELRQRLVETFPHADGAIPPLPPKSVISRFRPRFLERRKVGLVHFLNCILLNPEFAGSPVLKEFLFS
ncbi:Phox homologous domain-containing protein [Clohesyomyces aquaticus]|uniref:Endosomal/vacuolar adapter protein YPT35 n=1 Tax=Clohesyomyces aquaticus TaxID=1231657 RepID=A0A1Y1ZXT6_9PLEO|nr:Phox homologous domain-containing protein [Clohesyomyces aquaticus]